MMLFGFILPALRQQQQTNVEETLLNEEESNDTGMEGIPEIIVLHGDTGEKDRNAAVSSDEKKSVNTLQNDVDGVQACRIPKLDINGSEVIGFFSDPEPLNCDKNNEANWAYVDDDRRFQISPKAVELHGDIKCAISYFRRIDDDNLETDELVAIQAGDLITSSDYSVFRLSICKILGFDSLSQMSFRRKLPLTVKYVEETLEAVVLDGYNIVGDGTPQAFIPILTGQTEEELPLTRKRFKGAHYVDEVYPFVWQNFSDAGYITLYGEDAAAVGTFTYRLKGFKKQPTDHYTRTFFQKAEKMLKSMNCVGSVPLHKDWFRYTSEFMHRYNATTPKFMLAFHSLLSHDNINLVQVADADTAEHLKNLHESGALDNAVVIAMADHGHRFAQFRGTHQGQLEERLPFFAISLPKKFRESERGRLAWKNLNDNKDRLTTPFDIHATLLDILHWPTEKALQTMGSTSQRSLSLFRPVPISRTCDQAGIEPHWCTCLNWESAMDTPEQVNITNLLAKAVVQALNAFTKPERKLCAPLRLARVESSRRLVPHSTLLKYKNAKDADGFVPDLAGDTKTAFAHYQFKFVTQPGGAVYEVTVKYDLHANKVTVDMATISHVNKYGDAPHCIIDKNYFMATYYGTAVPCSSSASHCDFVFAMPFGVRKQLSSILDPGNSWEPLAALMPDINNDDVEACRRARDSESPTEILLSIWGSKGNRITLLYNLLARARLVRAMEAVRHLVDSKYHHWEVECVRSGTLISATTSKGSSEALRNQAHLSTATRLSADQHSSPNVISAVAAVSSKQQQPAQNLSSATSATSYMYCALTHIPLHSATSESNDLLIGLQNTTLVRYEEITIATDHFASENFLGKGGYGVVYKGNWKHTQVAVKCIKAKNDAGIEHDKERLRQSLQELRTLAKYRHDNILPLYGYSLDGPIPCLIYQFMANGSLEDRILCRKGTTPLTWSQRRNIAEGSARGLHFLHSVARTPIIHGDVKSANILLDKHLEPKLGDFGLCRDGQVETGPGEKTPLIASHIKGTLAYLPPEFITSKILTTKLDVYSFGVVLLEIATGLRAYVDNKHEPQSVVDYVTNVQARVHGDSTRLIDELADRRCPPTDQPHSNWFLQFIKLGLQCSQKDRDLRPTFQTILSHLVV
ncbi:unnamed protein product [Anisakis simplex]|uniref:non-specific serine/threonine protein kinase n=1 Tax=Anisakis simplex TaxID=6269 RepID=A0A158PP95_ANISI|nr:unnamed protein product [Anisakis simplex]